MNKIEERFKKYLKITEKAIKKVKFNSKIEVDLKDVQKDFLDMAKRYYEDAKYFKDKGDIVTAFASIVYAHAWLDAGVRLKLFDVKDSNLFMVD